MKSLSSQASNNLGDVRRHRLVTLLQTLCLTAKSRRSGLTVGTIRVSCKGICTARIFLNEQDGQGCRMGCPDQRAFLEQTNTLFPFGVRQPPAFGET